MIKYESEIETWMKTFYESLSPAAQRRYAAVEALKLGEDEEGIQYIVELLGCDAAEVDRARQEFVDGNVTADAEPVNEETSEVDFDDTFGGTTAGVDEAIDGKSAEVSPFDLSADDAGGDDEEAAAAAAFWQEDGDDSGDGAFAMAPSEEGENSDFGGFSGAAATTDEDSETASAVLETASMSKTRRKSRGPGPIANIVGIVVFGVIGLVAGYGILMAFFPDKDKQMLDMRGRIAALLGSETPPPPSGAPIDPNRDFKAGDMLTADESDPDKFVRQIPPRSNGDGVDPDGTTNPDNPTGTPDDPLGITPPDSGDVADPTEPDEGVDPFGIAIPTIDEPTIGIPVIGEPETGSEIEPNESEAVLVQTATGQRFSTAEIDESIDELVGLADDPEAKFTNIYRKLCVVGDRLTKPTKEASDDASVRADALKELLNDLSGDRDKLLTVATYSDLWLFSGKRNPADKGVVLAGTVTDVSSIQGGHKAKIRLIDPKKNGKTVTIVSDKVSNYVAGDNVIMIGTIITDPATELENYDGLETPIVFPAVTTKL